VAKLCAFREKDHNFVAALLDSGLVDGAEISVSLGQVLDRHRHAKERALSWLRPKASDRCAWAAGQRLCPTAQIDAPEQLSSTRSGVMQP